MQLPVNILSDNDYMDVISLGFNDGSTPIADNVYTGTWKLGDGEYNDRKFWYKTAGSVANAEYYMFYDAIWRYWVVDRTLGSTQSNQWHLFCLNWNEFQPFDGCETWYTATSGFTMNMDNAYIAPTEQTTAMPTVQIESTAAPTLAIETSQIIQDKVPESEIQRQVNESGAFHVSWMVWTMSGCVLCWGVCCVFFYLKKKRKQTKHIDFKGVKNSVYGISDNPDVDDVNLSMVQMNNFRYGAGTIGSATGTGTKGKGEILAMNDSDASSEEDDVVKHKVVDGTEGNMTLDDEDDNDQFLDDTDEDNELYGHSKAPTKKGSHQKKKSWVKF